MTTRRQLLAGAAGAAGIALLGSAARVRSADAQTTPVMDSLSGKRKLIKRTYRPPNYETPLEYFTETFTPNDAFFVRYHLANIPEIRAESWRMTIGGDAVEAPYELGMQELRRFEPVELAAVCQCMGTSRALKDTPIPGLDWGLGAMGNARWKGARLRDVLARARPRSSALEVVLEGADGPPRPTMPDFVKSLPIARALHADTLVAYEMNGEPLPRWNGQPVRLVVPGWAGAYWMKHLVSVQVSSRPVVNYWMNAAYRAPRGYFPDMQPFPSQQGAADAPITELPLNCMIANVRDGATLRTGVPFALRGIAWDGGHGIRAVDVSADGGLTWSAAELDDDYGGYSFRGWRYAYTPSRPGEAVLIARAVSGRGSTQPERAPGGVPGFHHHFMRPLRVRAV